MKRNTHHYNRKRKKKTNKAAKACKKGKLQLAKYEGEEVTLHAVIQRISTPTITGSEIGYQKTICVESVRIVEDNFQLEPPTPYVVGFLGTGDLEGTFALSRGSPNSPSYHRCSVGGLR